MRDYPPEYDHDTEGEGLALFERAFTDYENPWWWYRTHYKYTNCGVSCGMLVRGTFERVIEEPVVEWRGQEPVIVGTSLASVGETDDRWYYCDDLGSLGTFEDMRKAGKDIVAISVGSIVEGVDYDCDTQVIEIDPDMEPEALLQKWNEAVKAVEDQAREIWNDTHGCETCRAHWIAEGIPDGETELGCPVWMDCPACEGAGTII